MSPISFTDREREFIIAYFQCVKSQPDIDYEKFAGLVNLKNRKSAVDCMRPLLKKLMGGDGSGSASIKGGDADHEAEANAPAVKATPKKRKGIATSVDKASRKKRTPAKKGKKALSEDIVEEDDNADTKGEGDAAGDGSEGMVF